MSEVREAQGPFTILASEWVEVENNPNAIREKQNYLLLRAENLRRYWQGESGRLLTFDFTDSGPDRLIPSGFSQESLPDDKIKLTLTTYIIEEGPEDEYMDDASGQLKRFKSLRVIQENGNGPAA